MLFVRDIHLIYACCAPRGCLIRLRLALGLLSLLHVYVYAILNVYSDT